ncbi:MAG: NADPH:quinone oxidoreductase family protein [Acidobacteriota bacterium]
MKAIQFYEFGGPEVLKLEDVQDPEPASGQVLVRVAASGVNPADILGRTGGAIAPERFPSGIGRDAAGVVERVGDDVKDVKAGQQVVVRNASGAYAEMLVTAEENVFPLPDGLPLVGAASLGNTYSTAWDAVVNKAVVETGQNVLVQGASGGVGIAAVQLAKALGARVIGTASTEAKRAWVQQRGADDMVDYTQEDWPSRVKELTDGKGVDAVIDGVGGEPFVNAFTCIRRGAAIAIYGTAGGRQVNFPLNYFYRTMARVSGAGSPGCTREDFEKILTMFASGQLQPTVETTMPLEKAGDAHRLMEGRKVIGKIVLEAQA